MRQSRDGARGWDDVREFGRALAAAAALLLLGGPARAIDPLPADAQAIPDPAVRTGAFANGLRYAIMRNGTPAGAVSIRLAIRAGSYDEEESERGFAHFIEHMAFRSTRQAPEGSLDTRFASLGVAFGRDENATTGLESTIYQMDVPVGDPAAVAKVLEWLRGAADGILFTPAAVELEKGVVLAELRARTNPATIAMRETARFQAPGPSLVRPRDGRHRSLAPGGDRGRAPGLLRPLVPARQRGAGDRRRRRARGRCSRRRKRRSEAGPGAARRAPAPRRRRCPSAASTPSPERAVAAARRERLPDRAAGRAARTRASSGCAGKRSRRSG